MAKDKLEGKPRTVAAAKKAGSKFFFDKKGTKKLAVTAEELKKSGKTLKEWANTWKKSKSTKKAEPASAVKTSLRPKARPTKSMRPKARPDTVTLAGKGYGSMTVAEKKEVDTANAKIKADAAKRRQENLVKAKAHIASKKGTGLFKGNSPYLTYAKWSKMTDAQKKKTGLPVSMGKTKATFEVYMNALNGDK